MVLKHGMEASSGLFNYLISLCLLVSQMEFLTTRFLSPHLCMTVSKVGEGTGASPLLLPTASIKGVGGEEMAATLVRGDPNGELSPPPFPADRGCCYQADPLHGGPSWLQEGAPTAATSGCYEQGLLDPAQPGSGSPGSRQSRTLSLCILNAARA